MLGIGTASRGLCAAENALLHLRLGLLLPHCVSCGTGRRQSNFDLLTMGRARVPVRARPSDLFPYRITSPTPLSQTATFTPHSSRFLRPHLFARRLQLPQHLELNELQSLEVVPGFLFCQLARNPTPCSSPSCSEDQLLTAPYYPTTRRICTGAIRQFHLLSKAQVPLSSKLDKLILGGVP